ncbi:MAG: glutamate racemase, partial [Deltaproteobacteria bacterium]|nr:glutamate racemase [Deltaproteobacteria bacterium]
RAIQDLLPAESTIYLGDTARVPYGTKSREVVTRYAINNADFLVEQGIKLLVVACNTASSVALNTLKTHYQLPVLGVIEPGARRACEITQSNVVGVIGTEATIASEAYQQALRGIKPDLTILARSCPLFVPLAEEGWLAHPITNQISRVYLTDWALDGLDTLILGCTHYPVLVASIKTAVKPSVTLLDSASVVAKTVHDLLKRQNLARDPDSDQARHVYYVTDVPERFRRVGEIFLQRPLSEVIQVDIEPAGRS